MVDIREYKNGDEKEIIQLFNKVFNSNRKEEHWNWQFMENSAGKSVIVVAEDDSKIVGQCTLLPTTMVVRGEEVLAGQSIDTMINEDFRGKGIHGELANKSYEIGVENNIQFRFGFPSQMALRGLLGGIGGSLVTEIPLFTNYYRLDNILLNVVKIKFLAKILSIPLHGLIKFVYKEQKIKIKENYIFKEIEEFDEEFDKLWDKVKADSPIMTKRDSKFLNWRIKNHPDIDYKTFGAYLNNELAGYIITKTEKRKIRNNPNIRLGSMVDIMGINEDVIAALYFKVKEYFKSQNTDLVVTWASESMQYRGLLARLGFAKTRSTIPFVVKNLVENKELEETIADERNWYIMPIESDFY
jgi:hypothetical protein